MKEAFTLSEVLITLGIIGVVAAMTIPTLVQSYEEKATVAKLKKINSILNQAYQLAQIDNGPICNWSGADNTESGKIFWDNIGQNLKKVSECHLASCKIGYDVHTLAGSIHVDKDYVFENVVKLADGTYIFGGYSFNPSDCRTPNQLCQDFHVDINGSKGPNSFGKDIFNFVLTPNSIIPNGSPVIKNAVRTFPTFCSRKSTINFNGFACGGWIMNNDNMDYLHCDDLSWDGKHKCSD